MGGHSAIIYAHDIAPKIGKRKVVLRVDTDVMDEELKFKTGICSVADIGGLEKKLEAIDIARIDVAEGERFIAFRLLKNYGNQECS